MSEAVEPVETSVSDELFARVSTGIELCYQTFGDAAAEPLLMVMGLSAQLTWWPDTMCHLLAQQGFYVIRFDNRDAGRSERFPGGTGLPDRALGKRQLVAGFLGRPLNAPYTLSDMAADTVGLLDHLGIDRAHVVGASMGGMIVQTLAVEHPERLLSVVSIMSTTGSRRVGYQSPKLWPKLLGPAPRSQADYVKASILNARLIGSPGFPENRASVISRAETTWQRGLSSRGVMRQMFAIMSQPNRTEALQRVRLPFGVIHGLADPLVHVSGGKATARAVPGAAIDLIEGMGHDLPTPLHERYVAFIRRTADRARA